MSKIMIQGTTSSAGKSLMATGLCRIFKEDGYRIYPFKSQNMTSKYFKCQDGSLMSPAQALQALAAGLEPNPDMNPILLVPTSNIGSRVILMGEDKHHMEAQEYFQFRKSLKPMIEELYKSLEKENDVMVIEGAGSPAEINLKEDDIVNMGMAEIADAPVLLVADIDRGGVFASLYGTVMLLEEEERSRIKGLIINKFRGDKSLLEKGLKMIEDLLNIPVVGVVPFEDFNFPEIQAKFDKEELEKEFVKLSKSLRENLDIEKIYEIMGL